jgi:hypothetical protein
MQRKVAVLTSNLCPRSLHFQFFTHYFDFFLSSGALARASKNDKREGNDERNGIFLLLSNAPRRIRQIALLLMSKTSFFCLRPDSEAVAEGLGRHI